jgi:predicted transcriptional regulator
MAGRRTLVITERQFGVMRVLWEHGPLTVRGLMEHLPRGDNQPYTTVLGLMQTMEKAGLVEHEKEGLTHRYRPLISRQEATGNLLADFMRRFFHGSAEQLVLGLVDAEHLSAGQLAVIEERIGKAKPRGGSEAALSGDRVPLDKPRRGRKPS